MAKYVYILGAGYSRSSYPDMKAYMRYYEPHGYTFEVGKAITGDTAEIVKGAPLTGDLLSDAMSLDIDQLSLHEKEKQTFLKSKMITREWLSELQITDYGDANIQDILTYLDMKLTKTTNEVTRKHLDRVRFAIANILSMLLYARLGHSSQELDRKFVSYLQKKLENLRQTEPDSEIVIVNLNWDLVMDNALKAVFGTSLYNLPLARSGEFVDPHTFISKPYYLQRNGIRLIKPHGSLNWLWCRGCEELIVFEGTEITRYILPFAEDRDDIYCKSCDKNTFEPVIITPSLYRNIFAEGEPTGLDSKYQKFLNELWIDLEASIEGVTHLEIIGYSLPNEDKEIRYYLREAILHSPSFSELRIVTGSPKDAPTEEQLASDAYVQQMEETYYWKNYNAFFGNILDVSVERNHRNFWTCGFFEYFRRYYA